MVTFVVIEFVVRTHGVEFFTIQLDDEVIVRLALEEGLVERDVVPPRLVGERVVSLFREPRLM